MDQVARAISGSRWRMKTNGRSHRVALWMAALAKASSSARSTAPCMTSPSRATAWSPLASVRAMNSGRVRSALEAASVNLATCRRASSRWPPRRCRYCWMNSGNCEKATAPTTHSRRSKRPSPAIRAGLSGVVQRMAAERRRVVGRRQAAGGGRTSEQQVFHGDAAVDELFERGDADAHVVLDVGVIDHAVADGGLDAVGEHGLIRDKQERAGGDLVEEADAEDGGGFHVHGHDADFAQVVLEGVVVFPDAAVGGIDGAGPVVAGGVADGGGDGFLQGEGGQGGDFGREVVGAGAFAADGGDG